MSIIDRSQPTLVSDAELKAAFNMYGAKLCRTAADQVMGNGTIRLLLDIPQQHRREFLAVLQRLSVSNTTASNMKQNGPTHKFDAEPGQSDAQKTQKAIAVNDAQLIANGYEPLALAGKRALGTGWPSRPNTLEAIVAERAALPNATNTGARTGRLSVNDIDLIPPEHAAAMKALSFNVLSQTHLERIGSKGMALCYRNETPIGKITVSGLHATLTHVVKEKIVPLPGKVEILGIGQQLAIYGDHPDTGRPYTWPNANLGSEPLRTKLCDAPETTPAKLRDFARRAKALMEELGYRDVTASGDMDDERALGPEPNTVKPAQPKKQVQDGVTVAQLDDMLAFIDPLFNGIAPANFNAKKFDSDFSWGMNEWAGIARMIWNGEIPLVGDGAEDFNGPSVSFDWSSGKLWRERTGEEISTSCPNNLEARLSGKPGSLHYTVGTIIKLARACGYNGPVGAPNVCDFAIGSDIELAQRLVADLEQEYGSVVIHAEGDFYYYDGERWAALDENDLRLRAHRYDGKRHGRDRHLIRLNKSRVTSILCEAAVEVERPGFFDTAATGINCKNGFITFDKKGVPSLDPHDPKHRTRHVISATWLPEFDLSWEAHLLPKLLDGCFRNDADKDLRIDLIGEICGAVAMGMAPWMLKQPLAFVLIGKHANNGKSQILDMIRGLVPHEAVASVNPSQFDEDAYRLKLRGKLLNTASELGTARTISSEAFKYLVTGDAMTVNVKYKPAVEFRARAVHIFATNVLPPFQGGMDRGVRRRLCVVNFTRVFEPHEMIEGIGQRIAAEEADALLTFAVAGASRLLSRGKYTEPASCTASLLEWVHMSDPVIAWIECRTEYAIGHPALQHDLKSDFVRWARREGYDEMHLPGINNFVQRILGYDARIASGRVGKAGKGGRVLRGLKLLPDEAIRTGYEDSVESEPGAF